MARVQPAVGVALAAVVFLWSWEIVGHTGYAHLGTSDVGVYDAYAAHLHSGEVPYRDFPVEYPPGALIAFAAPLVAGDPGHAHAYDVWFARAMGALGVVGVLIVWLVRPKWAPLAFVALSPLLIGPLALTRFDLWPTVLTLGAVAALLRDRHRLGWGLLGLAFGTKLYPLVLVPLAAVWTYRRRGGRELAVAATVGIAVAAVAFVPFAILAPHGLWESVWGQASRPLEIESLAAAYLKVRDDPTIVGNYGALAIEHHRALAAATTAVGVLVLVALWIGFARGAATPERLARFAAACVCCFIAFGKVLSPQYLIWLVPLVPLVRGTRGVIAALLLALAILATDVFFYSGRRFGDYAFGSHLAWLVLARDLVLVVIVAILAIPVTRRGLTSS